MKHDLHITLLFAAFLLALPGWAQTPANVREEMRMDKPFITDEQTHRETLPQVAASRDSLVRVTTKRIHTYIDTIRVVRYSEDSVPRYDTSYIAADTTGRKGHYVQAYIGGGYGSLNYHLDPKYGGKVTGFFSGRAQVQYAYFFHPHWGVGAGLWFENLTSTASLADGMAYADFKYIDRIDTDKEPHYSHVARIYEWKERETTYNVAIPVSIQTQWWNEAGEVGFFGSLGIAPTFSVSSKYRLMKADVQHFGQYPNWGLTLDEMHDYQRNYPDNPDLYTSKDKAQGKMSISPMATIFAEIGVLVNLSRQLDMLVGLYGHYTPNNTVTKTFISKYLPDPEVAGKDAPPFGWGPDQGVGPSTFMDEYEGLYATNLRVGNTNPWAVGLKVGIHWHHIPQPKRHVEQHFDHFFRADTTIRTVERMETEVIERIDTFHLPVKEEVKIIQKKVDKLNKLFFAFDSYTLNSKSKKYLREIYEELKDIPNHIIIGGHSSEEGQAEYNEQLALNRAKAVKKYLVELGIPEAQLEVKNYGARVANEERVDDNISLDRRVEIIIVE